MTLKTAAPTTKAFKQYLDISHFKCLWAKCLIGISVSAATNRKASKNQIHETMSFRHLRLNNNNEHFIYYPPSYQMINYFPKDSFLFCLSFSYFCFLSHSLLLIIVRCVCVCVCALVHLSTSFGCQMRIIYTLRYYLASITQSFVQCWLCGGAGGNGNEGGTKR